MALSGFPWVALTYTILEDLPGTGARRSAKVRGMKALALRRLIVLLAGGLILLAVIAAGQGEPAARKPPKARIVDLVVAIEGEQVLVSFRLVNAFDENLKRRLESGLATGIVFDFELVRKRRMWFNKTLATGQLQVSAMYNAISREYLVNYKHDGVLVDTRLVREAEALYAAMSEFERLAVFPLDEWRGEVVVRARAELGTGSLLFFIPTLKTTDWAEEPVEIEPEATADEAAAGEGD